MQSVGNLQVKNKSVFRAAIIVMLLMAFVQCYKTTYDLHWAADPDFDRDIAFVQGTLDGHFGRDPNYKGEYLWYNPLLFSIETVIVKISGLPISDVVTRSGPYLNILCPIFFVLMVISLFDFKVASAALLSYLFFATGNIFAWGAATYSPWLYPDCFVQILFYLNIIVCYKAFSKQSVFWFSILGITTGLNFLGHTAPAILSILILIYIQGENIIRTIKEKDFHLLRKYFIQSLATFMLFLLVASPLLYFVAGKYNLHYVNRATFEYAEGIFLWNN